MRYIFVILFLITTVFAHKLNLFYTNENNKVFFSSYFASGSGCKQCEVYIYDKDKKLVKNTQTDDKGEFILEYFEGMIVKVETIGGHAVEEKVIIENINKNENAQKTIDNKNEEVKKNSIIETILSILAIGFIFYLLKRFRVGRV